MHFCLRTHLLIACGTLCVSQVNAAAAQSDSRNSQPSGAELVQLGAVEQADSSERGTLEDIVVTAQKRSESAQNVPIAITAISASALEKNRILSTRDLQLASPALVFNQATIVSQPFLRGIGSDLVGPNLDASVATYVDGIYVSANIGTVINLLGVERVEILSGPQGTLFGRNAVGGAISVYTLTPSKRLEARLSTTYGNYDRASFTGYISGPVTDTLSIGLYGGYERRHTYFKDLNPDDPSHENRKGLRIKAVWTPAPNLKITASAEHLETRGIEAAGLRNIQPDALGYALGATTPIGNYVYDGDIKQHVKVRTDAYTLKGEWDFDWASLVSLSGYRDLKGTNVNDLDGTNVPLLATFSTGISKQLSQELQLLSPTSSTIKWLAGLFYFRERAGFVPTGIVSSIIFPPPIGASVTEAQVKTRSYAAFAQATAPLAFLGDSLSLTLGARYTRDEKSYAASSKLVQGTGLSPGDAQVGPVTIYPDDSHSWEQFTPKISLEHKNGDTLLYATYSRGFKAGAYNIATPTDPGPVNPERLEAYEIGSKSDLAGGRLRINLSSYYYRFRNLQVQLVSAGSGGTTTLQNAGAGKAYGMEATILAVISPDLTLNSSIALEHAKYTSFKDAASFIIQPGGNVSAAFDVSGNRLQRTPKVAFNLGGDYSHSLDNGGTIELSVKWYHNSGYFWEPTNRLRQNAYSLVNLSAGYVLPDGRLSIRAFVSNLTNANTQTGLLFLPTSIVVGDAEPRMYGATLSWKI